MPATVVYGDDRESANSTVTCLRSRARADGRSLPIAAGCWVVTLGSRCSIVSSRMRPAGERASGSTGASALAADRGATAGKALRPLRV